MKHFVVEYNLPYEHSVRVGIRVDDDNPETAIAIANQLFDEGTIWDDTQDVPLLLDEYYECGDAGVPLQFTVVAEGDEWPSADGSVETIRRANSARNAARLLIHAYQRGHENGGSVDWDDLDQAYKEALKSV